MKPLIIIPITTFAFIAVAVALLTACGAKVSPSLPLTAAVISAAAGMLGISPLLAARRKDPVGIFQLALVGTLLHLFAAVGFTALAIACHTVPASLNFVYWLLAGYWISLIVLLWQLRHRLLGAISPDAPASKLNSATL